MSSVRLSASAFFVFLTLVATLLSPPAKPETLAHAPRIGVLVPPIPAIFEIPLRDSLRDLGYIDGKSVFLDVRRSQGSQQGWRALADDLVRSKVDLILAVGTPAARAAMDSTTEIPIVFGVGDAINTSLTPSLAKPRRNGTGITTMSTELSAKRLELLLELAPRAHRVAYLYNPTSPLGPRIREQVERAAVTLRVQLDVMEAKDADQIDAALKTISRNRPDGFLVSSEVLFIARRDRIVEAVAKVRLPTVFPWRIYATEGGVASYGASNEEGMRRMAIYADKVLRARSLPTFLLNNYRCFT